MILNTMPRSDFKINYRIDCSNLCSDFKYVYFRIFACFMHVDVSNWVFESREDISFHFSLGFSALMPRFSGNKSINSSKYFFNANIIFSTSATNLNSYASLPNRYMVNKDMQSMSILSSSNATSSNLNPFGQGASDNPNNLLLVLQALQIVTSKSNVILIAVGGIVNHQK